MTLKAISVTLLIAFFVLLLNVEVFAHSACQSEQNMYDAAMSSVENARIAWTAAAAAWSLYVTYLASQGKPPEELSASEATNLATLSTAAAAAYLILSNCKSSADGYKAALDQCIEADKRDCPSRCSRLHTQNSDSCECDCDHSQSQGCECGPCSATLGGG